MSTFSVASRLREERIRLRLSQAELAKKAGVHRNTQIKYESGDRQPDIQYLDAVKTVGVDIAYVLGGTKSVDSRSAHLESELEEFGRALLTVLGIQEPDLMAASARVSSGMKAQNEALELLGRDYFPQWKEAYESEYIRALMPLVNRSAFAQSCRQDLDTDLLQQVIEGVESSACTSTRLTPSKKARIIAMIYRTCQATGRFDMKYVTDTLLLVEE